MNTLLRLEIWLRSKLSTYKGQAMTEYALILAAVAVIAYASYRAMGRAALNGVLDEIAEELRLG
jgi:Flp pilus assembly pilin Flp